MTTTPDVFKDAADKLRAAHPGREVCKVPVPDHGLVFLALIPDDGEYKRFRDAAQGDGQGPQALRALVANSVKAAFEKGDQPEIGEAWTETTWGPWFRRRAGLYDTVGNQLLKAAGVSSAASVEKI
jgi:hypothetical protein